MDILTAGLSLLLSVGLGNYLVYKFQKRTSINQIKLAKRKEEVQEIREISNLLSSLVFKRMHASFDLAYAVDGKNNLKWEDCRREAYRQAVKDWNLNIKKIFLELHSLGLGKFSKHIEDNIHRKFREIHLLIVESVSKNIKINSMVLTEMDDIERLVNNVCYELVNESNNRWMSATNKNYEKLSAENLHDANFCILIRALFHPNPFNLRVVSSERY